MYVLETISGVEFRPGSIISDVMYWVLKLKHRFRFNLVDAMIIRTGSGIFEFNMVNVTAKKLFGIDITRAIYPYKTFCI